LIALLSFGSNNNNNNNNNNMMAHVQAFRPKRMLLTSVYSSVVVCMRMLMLIQVLLPQTCGNCQVQAFVTVTAAASSPQAAFIHARRGQVCRSFQSLLRQQQRAASSSSSITFIATQTQTQTPRGLCKRSSAPARTTPIYSSSRLEEEEDTEVLPPFSASVAVAALQSLTFYDVPASISDDSDRIDIDIDAEIVLSSDLLSDFLMELGAVSVSSNKRITDSEEEQDQDQENVVAHFAASFDLSNVVNAIQTTFAIKDDDDDDEKSASMPAMPRFTIDTVDPNEDWIINVQKEHWKPMLCSGFLLQFPWHTEEDLRAAVALSNNEENEMLNDSGNTNNGLVLEDIPPKERLTLQGGIAFGSGDHPTTRLCLAWVRQLMTTTTMTSDGDKKVRHFLDYGAGSGVLGLAACALATAAEEDFQAVGVEIDVDAIQIANENARMNGVVTADDKQQITMKSYLPQLDDEHLDNETLSKVMTTASSTSSSDSIVEVLPAHLDAPQQLYDACVANILALPLMDLAPVIASMMREGAPLGLSGILVGSQAEAVLDIYRSSSFFDNMQLSAEEEGWVLLTGTRNGHSTSSGSATT
jgi:ribosomal protein L11 methylase PrmA